MPYEVCETGGYHRSDRSSPSPCAYATDRWINHRMRLAIESTIPRLDGSTLHAWSKLSNRSCERDRDQYQFRSGRGRSGMSQCRSSSRPGSLAHGRSEARGWRGKDRALVRPSGRHQRRSRAPANCSSAASPSWAAARTAFALRIRACEYTLNILCQRACTFRSLCWSRSTVGRGP